MLPSTTTAATDNMLAKLTPDRFSICASVSWMDARYNLSFPEPLLSEKTFPSYTLLCFSNVLYVRWIFLRQHFSRPLKTDTTLKHIFFSGYHIEINFLLPQDLIPSPKQTTTVYCCLL
jgi:hypothetical protein